MSYRRGDVVLVLFPDSGLRTAKRRPALVVQADGLGTGLSQVVVAMITSNMARAGVPFRVRIDLGSVAAVGSGLRTHSVVMGDNIATVLLTEIDRAIGSLRDMGGVDAALRVAMGV